MNNELNKKDYYYDGYNDNDKLLFNFDGFNINENKMDFKKFNSILKQLQKDIYSLPTITLFHGTSLELFEQILENGILPTNNKNRNSYQSTNGFVYTTPFLYLAQRFGSYAASWKQQQNFQNDIANSIVYKLELEIRYLKPDKDQINNFNSNNIEMKLNYNLANSIFYGKSLCHEGKIYLNSIKSIILYDIENNKNVEIEFDLSNIQEMFKKINELKEKNKIFEFSTKKDNNYLSM